MRVPANLDLEAEGKDDAATVNLFGSPMRLVYLDEAGSDHKAPHLAVAGVIVHGDEEWPEVDRRILALINQYVDDENQDGFVFHATNVFHGNGYFDRKKPEWADREKRWQVLSDLAKILEDLKLPVVAGSYKKEGFGAGVLTGLERPLFKHNMLHDMAILDCLLHADRWLEIYSPSELAAVIHEGRNTGQEAHKRVRPRHEK